MKYLTLLFLILFSGCVIDDPKPEPIPPNTTCSSHQYTYYKNQKIDLSSRLINNYVTVGIDETDEHNTFSIDTELSDLRKGRLNGGSGDFGFSGGLDMYAIKPISCTELNNTRLLLHKHKAIRFVSLLYSRKKLNSDINTPYIENYEDFLFYTENFIVELNKSEDLELLSQMITKTKTTLVSEVKPNQYLIKTNVNSQGDALEMANYFHESSQFKLCIPDWNGFRQHIEPYDYFY